MAGWTAFAKQCDIFKGNIETCLKRQIVHNPYVLPEMTYGAVTWAIDHQPSKEQASSHTNKDGNEYVKYHAHTETEKQSSGKKKDKSQT